jgi:hypothetical protein
VGDEAAMKTGEPRLRVVLAAFVGVCALADVSPIAKLHPPSIVLRSLVAGTDGSRAWTVYWALVAIAIALPTFALGWVARWRSLPGGSLARFTSGAMVAAMFAVARIVVHRAETLRAVGRGSDLADCIEMPARAFTSGHWPYDRALIWSGNACSPGMGWIALATPFVLTVGYAVFLVAGAIAFVALPERVLGARTVTAFLALTLSCVTAWQSLATGADALAIGIGLVLVTMLSASARGTIPVAVLAGLLASARLPLAFFPLLIAAFLFADGERRRAVRFGAVALGTLALVHGVPLAIDARSYVHDGPLHVFAKVQRFASTGGWAIFVACGVAWVAYAAWCLRRLAKGAPSPVARLFDVGTLTLLTIAGPALTVLVDRVSAAAPGDGWTALQTWEGGNWLIFALPCYAAALALALRESDAPRAA